jgi:hypothetical protein
VGRGSERAALYWSLNLTAEGDVDDDIFATVFATVFAPEGEGWSAVSTPYKISGKGRAAFLEPFPLEGAPIYRAPAPAAGDLGSFVQERLDAARSAEPTELIRLAEELVAAFTLETGTLSDRVIEALLEARVADSLTWEISIDAEGLGGRFAIERRHGNLVGCESGSLEFERADGGGVRISAGKVARLTKTGGDDASKLENAAQPAG